MEIPTTTNTANFAAEDELQELLAAWRGHQQLHDSGASLAELWQSRKTLDERRLEVRLAA